MDYDFMQEKLDDIAKAMYEKRCKERAARTLVWVPWFELDLSVQRHWRELVELVLKLTPEPPPPEVGDIGL